MHSGNSNLSVKHPAVSIGIGIASLVLEGRLIASEDDDDENFKAIHDFHGGNGPGLSGANGKSPIDPPIVSDNGSSVARHHGILKDVTERISVKLQQLRQCPGTSKEIIETTIAVPTNAHGDENRGTESGVHVRTNENRYPGIQNRRLFVYNSSLSSAPPSSTSSAAKSILHEIDVDWNDTTVLYNGLEKINITSSPIKMALPPSLRSSVVPDRFKMNKKKLEKSASSGSIASNNTVGPKQGPHCQQFLKNIGIVKDDGGDHLCNHVNSYCRRWQFYLRRVGNILMKGDDTCIEVYLGPENNAILLEQWTFNLTNKPSQSTMTIQSLCSAIRSQLYFSQISSWMDLLKSTSSNSGPEEGAMKHMPFYYNREIMENPRLKKNLDTMEVHLDIFFLIKSFDGQANFNDKPNVHQFPDAKISDNMAIRVCLKSLPRLEKIPTLNTNKANLNGFSCDYRIKTAIQQRGGSPLAGSPTTTGGVLNDRMGYASCHEKGKHRCINDVDEDVELMGSDSNSNSPTTTSPSMSSEQLVSESSSESQDSQQSNAAQSHREKQLAKFKKLQMKRHKKKKAESGDEEKSADKVDSNNKNEFNYPPALSINATQSPLYATSPPIHATLPQNQISKTMSEEYSEMAEDNNNNNNNNFDGEKSKSRTETATTTNKTQNLESTSTSTTTTNRTLSIATQTDDHMVLFNQHNHHSAMMMMNAKYCDKCGNQMQCWNCDKSINLNSSNNNNEMCSSNNNNNINKSIIDGDKMCGVSTGAAGTMIGNKGDLLLQAIQRTGNAHSMDDIEVNKCCDSIAAVTDNNNKLTLFNNNKNNRNSNKSINSDKQCERSECDKNNLQLKNSSVLAVAMGAPIPSSTAIANNNHHVDVDASDCRECKRQKTQHNYSACQSPESVTSPTLSSGYRRTMSECMVGLNELAMMKQYAGENVVTPSPFKNRKCMDANAINDDDLKCGELKKYRRAFSEDTFNIDGEEEEQFDTDGSSNDDDDCITIKCHCPPAEENDKEDYKSTPVVNLQQINKPLHINLPTGPSYMSTSSSVSPHKKHIIVKTLHTPKINLAKVFSQQSFADDSGIGNEREEMDSPDGNNNQDDVFNFNRSQTDCFSYPPSAKSSALLQLSPRFIQSNALLKRRSRHFSDRSSISERSSIGSDEHLSDEDYHYMMQLNNNKNNSQQETQLKTPTSTPTLKKISLYKKFATKSQVAFNKLPLLGTLEESLLRNRLEPKSEVSGFNVLLGASGTFCPTQLTIPAQTFFYEFHGQQHMATPYVCELRLSRKGYSIPRTGTVQATLLNPLGTVVRMFVVPYDFRDMPAMSQTFIRQRVLALNDGNGIKNPDQLSTAEQMRFLRYAIHLRFQTGRSGRLCLHTDIKLLISRRTDCDTAAAHAKNSLESPSDLKTVTIVPDHPKFSTRIDK